MLKGLLGDLYTKEIADKIGDKQFAVVNDGTWIPRDKFNAVTEEVKAFKKQITERDAQLESLKGKAAGNEELLTQIETLKQDNIKTQTEYDTKLLQQAKNFAIDKAIATAQGKNPKAIKALLNAEVITLDGEKILGLTEQLEAIKKSDAYLFGGDKPPGAVGGGTNPAGGGNKPPDDNAAYEEAIKKGNVSLAIAIKNRIFESTKG